MTDQLSLFDFTSNPPAAGPDPPGHTQVPLVPADRLATPPYVSTTPTDSSPLREVRPWLIEHRDVGVHCPACGQFVKVYRRKINSGMARSLIQMYTIGGSAFLHVPTALDAKSREEGKLRYWGLVEEERSTRSDGGRAGWWRVTDTGRAWVLGAVSIPKYARIFNGHLLELDGSETVTVHDALGDKFDYQELMGSALPGEAADDAGASGVVRRQCGSSVRGGRRSGPRWVR